MLNIFIQHSLLSKREVSKGAVHYDAWIHRVLERRASGHLPTLDNTLLAGNHHR